MKNVTKEIPGYTPIAPEDLRIFPHGISWFVGNIIIMLLAIAFSSLLFALDFLNMRPDVYLGFGFGLSVVSSILCILIIRGNLCPIRYLRVISGGLMLLAVISGLMFFGERGNFLTWLGAIAAVVSQLIVRSEKYYNVAQFYKRMMERQFATGLTRAEDIMINRLLEEGTRDGFENARSIVIKARERIKRSPR